MVDEMMKFRKYLDEHNIKWIDLSEQIEFFEINRTHFTANGVEWSVINGFGTFGGQSFLEEKNQGLLEIWNFKEEPKGYLTCEEAVKEIFGS